MLQYYLSFVPALEMRASFNCHLYLSTTSNGTFVSLFWPQNRNFGSTVNLFHLPNSIGNHAIILVKREARRKSKIYILYISENWDFPSTMRSEQRWNALGFVQTISSIFAFSSASVRTLSSPVVCSWESSLINLITRWNITNVQLCNKITVSLEGLRDSKAVFCWHLTNRRNSLRKVWPTKLGGNDQSD